MPVSNDVLERRISLLFDWEIERLKRLGWNGILYQETDGTYSELVWDSDKGNFDWIFHTTVDEVAKINDRWNSYNDNEEEN